jgi:hypothetical protein
MIRWIIEIDASRIVKNFDENYRWKIFINNERKVKRLWIETLLGNSRLKIFKLLNYNKLRLVKLKESSKSYS